MPAAGRCRTWGAVALLTLAAVGLTVIPPAAATPDAGDGYWMLDADGVVHTFGQADFCGNGRSAYHPALYEPGLGSTDITPFPDNSGYWILDAAMVQAHSCVIEESSLPYGGNDMVTMLASDEVPVAVMAAPEGLGYWVVTSRGWVRERGSANWYGDMIGVRLNAPVIDAVATPSGKGYYLVAADGGIFTFGDARFSGSMGGKQLNEPVVSMAPDPDGRGYWLVASDGGIFSFDAQFYGSMGATRLNKPVTGIVPSPRGAGYLMVAADGGVFTFGDVPFYGSLGANPPPYPVISIAAMN